MKKLLFLALPLVVFSGLASAAVPQCSTGNYLGIGGDWSLAQLAGTGCEISDKIYSNFTGSTQDATDAFNFFNSGQLSTNVLLSVGTESTFSTAFTYGYTITVDPTVVIQAGKTASISNLTGNIGDSTNGSASTLVKSNNRNGCVDTVTDIGGTSVINSPGGGCAFSNPTTSVTVGEAFTYTGTGGGSGVTSLQNTWTQVLTTTTSSGTPEPVSLLLFGSGLLGLGFFGRKRMARR